MFVRPEVPADFWILSGSATRCPAEALVHFGLRPAVLPAFPRKRCTVFADSTFTSVDYELYDN
jgi:hypothetical protein